MLELGPLRRRGIEETRPRLREAADAVRAPASTSASRPEEAVRKRVADLASAVALLVPLTPLLLLLAIAIKLESRGPVLYRSRRVGLHGREFAMLKFRKMHRDAVGPPLTSANDERLTRFGSLLARTRLDELPQLWNVIRGDMSLVGPRPEDPAFVAVYPEQFAAVLRTKPGITGLSQLAFAKEDSILARPALEGRYTDRILPVKLETDLLYIDRWSLALDARIVLWTAAAVLTRREIAVDRRTARLSIRRAGDRTQVETERRAA